MNNALAMGVGKTGSRLDEDIHGYIERQMLIGFQKLGQVSAFQIVHNQVGHAIRGDTKIEDRKNIGMIETACRLRFLLESFQSRDAGN